MIIWKIITFGISSKLKNFILFLNILFPTLHLLFQIGIYFTFLIIEAIAVFITIIFLVAKISFVPLHFLWQKLSLDDCISIWIRFYFSIEPILRMQNWIKTVNRWEMRYSYRLITSICCHRRLLATIRSTKYWQNKFYKNTRVNSISSNIYLASVTRNDIKICLIPEAICFFILDGNIRCTIATFY